MLNDTHETAPNRSVQAGDVQFAYRRFGPRGAAPLLLLNYFAAHMDDWDPKITNGFAEEHDVILVDYPGIGKSSGQTPSNVAALTNACFAFCRGLTQFDVVGFSLGGMIAQQLGAEHPDLLRRIMLLGTGPRGGEGLVFDDLSVDELDDPSALLRKAFFTQSDASQASWLAYMERLKSRRADRDTPVSRQSASAELAAIRLTDTILGNDNHDLTETLKVIASEIGLSHIPYVRLPHEKSTDLCLLAAVVTYSRVWQQRYFLKKYVTIDPVIPYGRGTAQPFDWANLPVDDPATKAFFTDALNHGVGRNGLSIPLRGHRVFALVSLTSDLPQDEWEHYKAANIKGLKLLSVLIDSASHINFKLPASPAHLSNREEQQAKLGSPNELGMAAHHRHTSPTESSRYPTIKRVARSCQKSLNGSKLSFTSPTPTIGSRRSIVTRRRNLPPDGGGWLAGLGNGAPNCLRCGGPTAALSSDRVP